MTQKERFLKSPAGKAFFDVSASEAFNQALDAALLQHLSELPVTDDPVKAAANFHRISGAMQFSRTLKDLGVMDAPQAAKQIGQLDHKAK